MKILPSNQSLILAGEPGGPRGRLAADGATLQRVTILTARQDSTVVVQADYYSHDDALPFDSQFPLLHAPANDAPAADATDSAAPSRPAVISSYLNPIALYARTQRVLEDTFKPALIDVLA